MEVAEKQISDQKDPDSKNSEDETQTKSEELVNTKVTDQEIPGITSSDKLSIAQADQSETSADSYDEADQYDKTAGD